MSTNLRIQLIFLSHTMYSTFKKQKTTKKTESDILVDYPGLAYKITVLLSLNHLKKLKQSLILTFHRLPFKFLYTHYRFLCLSSLSHTEYIICY